MMTMTSTTKVSELSHKYEEKIRALRHHIHRHPELSFHESGTAKLVAETMRKLGYEVQIKAGGLGVVADLGKLGSQGKRIGLRADMDALPINEDTSQPYCSTIEGVMHACGHDVHTACTLGAAMILAEMHKANELPGAVRFIFQPAEESTNDDGKSGATLMIEGGAIEDLAGVIGLHVFPDLPVGTIGLRTGSFLAACDKFDITITGKGCHGAFPQNGIDAVVLASQAVQTIQTIISRRKSALSPCVLTLGGIRSTTYKSNIIAETVELTGTARYFEPEISAQIKTELSRALSVVESMGGSFTLDYITENPPLVNDSALTETVREAAQQIAEIKQIVDPGQQMGAEDFSFYCEAVPSCFIVLGAEIAGDKRSLHTPRFDVDESSLPIGAALLAQAALTFLDH